MKYNPPFNFRPISGPTPVYQISGLPTFSSRSAFDPYLVCETQYWQLSIQAGLRVTKGLYAILQSSQSLSHSHRVVSHMRDIVILYERLCKVTMSAKCPSFTPPNRTPWQSKPLCVTPWLVSGMIATSSVLPPCWNRVNYPQTNPIQSTRFRIHSPV